MIPLPPCRRPRIATRRAVVQTLAASLLLPAMGAAQAQIAVSTAINRIARYRALSQRIAKVYVQMQLGVLPDQAAAALAAAQKLVRSGFEDLQKVPWPAELAGQIAAVRGAVDTLQALLVVPPSMPSVLAVATQADRVLSIANTATEAFEKSSKAATAKLVNVAGRQRALSQRLAKNYFLLATGGEFKGAREELASDAQEFRSAMAFLAGAPLSTPAIREELALGEGQWLFFGAALQRKADARGLADVATTSERLLEVTDRLTNLYDAALKEVLG